MSLRASAYAKELTHFPATGQQLRASQKLMLMVLADYHNVEEGAAWPSHARLARESLVSRRHVVTLLAECVEGGVLAIEERKRADGGRTSNRYRFVELDPCAVTSQGGEEATSLPSEVAISPESDSATSPKPLLNRIEQQSDPTVVHAAQIWSVIRDRATALPDNLTPASLIAGTLVLRAPTTTAARRWGLLLERDGATLCRLAPVPLAAIRVCAPGEAD